MALATLALRKCKATTKAGEPCPWNALKNSDYCFSHDPDKKEERQQARVAGGKARCAAISISREEAENEITTVRDVIYALSECVQAIRAGKMTWSQGQSVSSLLNTLLKAIELDKKQGESKPEVKKDIKAQVKRIRELYSLPPLPDEN